MMFEAQFGKNKMLRVNNAAVLVNFNQVDEGHRSFHKVNGWLMPPKQLSVIQITKSRLNIDLFGLHGRWSLE